MEVTVYTLEELREVFREEIESINTSGEKLLTREEAAEFLSISLPTLGEWTKSGKIKCHRIPKTGRVYYLKSDLLVAVVECSVS